MNARPRILVLNGSCLDVIDSHRAWLAGLPVDIVDDPAFRQVTADRLGDLLADAHAVILPAAAPISARHMEAAPALRVLAFAASGFETADVKAATRLGIVVTNAPVPEVAEAVAEMTWGLLLAAARQIPRHHAQVCSGDLRRGMGVALWKKTLGIVGLGQIGRAVAQKAGGFGMHVLATEPDPDRDFVAAHAIELVPLEELLRRSDVVSLHVRLSAETRHMLAANEFSLMKSSAILVNTARKELVDEAALEQALVRKQIAGAGLDDPPSSTGSPLCNLPNVVFTPHLGNRVYEGVDAVFRCAVQQAMAVLSGRRPEHVVNPEVYAGALRAAVQPAR